MALRTSVTERQRRLGAELRKLRERAELSTGDASALIGMGRAHLSHIEAGRTAIATDRLRALCLAYGCTSEPYVDALVSMAEDSGKGWWTKYKDRMAQPPLNLAELEAGATAIHSHESLFIPGLFQVEDYTRAILASAKPVQSTIDDATAFRMDRQRILTGENAPAVHAVIHEAALHMRFGGPEVMRSQLLRLIELARLPNVTIQVFPFEAGVYAAFSGTFLHIIPAVHELSTIVLEHPIKSLYLGDEEHIVQYSAMFDRLTEHALPPVDPDAAPETHAAKDSLGLIQHILYTL